jgi:hypothetical protein
MTTNDCVESVPRAGYKVVYRDGTTLFGGRDLKFTVGVSHRLPAEHPRPVCGQWGFHYCPVALNCLGNIRWDDGKRLLRVTVPDDAVVVTNDSGLKCAASALTVVEDVTHDVERLLTGVLHEVVVPPPSFTEWTSFRGGKVSSIPPSKLVSVAHHANGMRIKTWDDATIRRFPCGDIEVTRDGAEPRWVVATDVGEWTQLDAELACTDFT